MACPSSFLYSYTLSSHPRDCPVSQARYRPQYHFYPARARVPPKQSCGRVLSSDLISYLALGKVCAKPKTTLCDGPVAQACWLGFLKDVTEGCVFHSPVFTVALHREYMKERLERWRSLPCKHEDLSWIPRTWVKMPSLMGHTHNLSPGEAETGVGVQWPIGLA